MKDIHGLKPLEQPAANFWLPILIVFGLLLLVMLVFALRSFLNQRGKRRKPADLPLLSPEAEAFEGLTRLGKMGLIERGRVKQYHELLSGIMRRYLERRLRVRALERTTEEMIHDLSTLRLPQTIQSEIRSLCLRMDLVKFAGKRPSRQETTQMTEEVHELIRSVSRHRGLDDPEGDHVAV